MIDFDFEHIKPLFSTKRKILLTSHTNPDGDALGAGLALFHFFKQMGHEVYFMVPNNFPGFLDWMPASSQILIFDTHRNNCESTIKSADILFSLDYNSPQRLGDAEHVFRESSAIKVLIDHHINPEREAYDYVYSTVNISSTSELVYLFMEAIDDSLINKEIADCVFTGIMTDTGSFSYNCNYPGTFNIVAKLINKGLQTHEVNRLVYGTFAESRLRLLGFSLSEKLVVKPEYHTAYIALTGDELKHYNYQTGDTEGLVNYALSVKETRFAALFTQRKDKIRISFRSVGEFSVNDFAREHFYGGGHRNAAGGDSYDDMPTTIAKFESLLERYAEKLQ